MSIIHKYISFLREQRSFSEDVRSGNKNINSVDMTLFNFGAEYEFVIPYDKFVEAPGKSTEKVKKDIENMLGISIAGSDKYVSQEKAKSVFRLTYDESIKSNKFEDYNGVEFVTPVVNFDEFTKITKKLFDYIEIRGFETSSTSGLHVGISYKDETKNKNINPLKVVVFAGDQFMRQTWPRIQTKLTNGEVSSDYVKSNIETIRKIIKKVVFYADNIEQLNSSNIDELFFEWLDSATTNVYNNQPEWRNKHFAVNVGRLKDGYVEFRVIGGQDYHKRYDEVISSVKKFTLILEQSSSEDTRKDYLKKLYKILNTALEDFEDYEHYYNDTNSDPIKITITNPKILKLLDRASLIFVKNPKLKERMLNVINSFEKDKLAGIHSLLYLLTLDFGNIPYKAMLRSLIVNIVKIYGVSKTEVIEIFNKQYFEKGKIPEKPDDDDEDSEYWAYVEGDKMEHTLSIPQVIKILGV